MKALARNLAGNEKTFLNDAGLYDSDGTLSFRLSSSAVEHSFLTPDDGTFKSTIEVPVVRLDTYFKEKGCRPNFLKIEAEGVEIEVFEGLGELRPEKIAIDVSPEPDQLSPADYLTSRLKELGYTKRQRQYMLFAHA